MELSSLLPVARLDSHKNLLRRYDAFEQLLAELKNRQLPDTVIAAINVQIDLINQAHPDSKKISRQLRKSQGAVLELLEKEMNVVVKKHYQMRWLALGLAVFGVPLGVSFGLTLGNMAFLGIGLPIGMVIGMAIGSAMDKKAAEEGRQLDVDIL